MVVTPAVGDQGTAAYADALASAINIIQGTRNFAYQNLAQAMSGGAGGFTALTNFTSIIDMTGNFNTATGLYTVAAAGLYEVTAQILFNTGTTRNNVVIYRNGASLYQSTSGTLASTDVAAVLPRLPVNLLAGDTLQLVAYTGSAGVSTYVSGTTSASFIYISRIS